MVLLEMARPNTIVPKLIGWDLSKRYEEIMEKVTNCMKYGKDVNGNDLIDINGNIVEGMGDDILQDRKYRYFFFHLNGFDKTINLKSNSLFLDYIKADVKAQKLVKEMLIEKNLWKISTTTKLLVANSLSILKHENCFLSPKFENKLLNSNNLANYMQSLRVKHDGMRTSASAAAKKEKIFGMGIEDIHGTLARTRDLRSKMNRDNGYKNRSENRKRKINEI